MSKLGFIIFQPQTCRGRRPHGGWPQRNADFENISWQWLFKAGSDTALDAENLKASVPDGLDPGASVAYARPFAKTGSRCGEFRSNFPAWRTIVGGKFASVNSTFSDRWTEKSAALADIGRLA